MATLIDAAEFTSNEVYQIQATDPVEGAASGASFSGTGISNQPHQQLANRTAFLKQRQDVNISNIGVLQAFQALFTGLMGAERLFEDPGQRHQQRAGSVRHPMGSDELRQRSEQGLYGPYSFPIAFPNACVNLLLTTLIPETGSEGGGENEYQVPTSVPLPSKTQFYVWNNYFSRGAEP